MSTTNVPGLDDGFRGAFDFGPCLIDPETDARIRRSPRKWRRRGAEAPSTGTVDTRIEATRKSAASIKG